MLTRGSKITCIANIEMSSGSIRIVNHFQIVAPQDFRNTPPEVEARFLGLLAAKAIGLKAQNSVDYIHLYSGDKETLVSSLECIQRTSAEILAAIAPSG